jgi:DNA-binding MarR family transcriptional regulator
LDSIIINASVAFRYVRTIVQILDYLSTVRFYICTKIPDGMAKARTSGRSQTPGSERRPASTAQPANEAWALLRALFDIEPPSLKPVASEFGLLPPQVIALRQIARRPSLAMRELGTLMHSDKSTITWIADQLEQRGLIERRGDPNDRRVRRLAVTDHGARVHAELESRLNRPPVALTRMPPNDQRLLRDVLRRAETQRTQPSIRR